MKQNRVFIFVLIVSTFFIYLSWSRANTDWLQFSKNNPTIIAISDNDVADLEEKIATLSEEVSVKEEEVSQKNIELQELQNNVDASLKERNAELREIESQLSKLSSEKSKLIGNSNDFSSYSISDLSEMLKREFGFKDFTNYTYDTEQTKDFPNGVDKGNSGDTDYYFFPWGESLYLLESQSNIIRKVHIFDLDTFNKTVEKVME